METNHKHNELERALRASQATVGELIMEVGQLQAAADKATPSIDTPSFRNRVARMRNMSTARGKDDYKALVAEIHAWHTGQSASVIELTGDAIAWALVTPTGNIRYWSRSKAAVERQHVACPNEVLVPILGAAIAPTVPGVEP